MPPPNRPRRERLKIASNQSHGGSMNGVQPGTGDSLVAPAFKPGYRFAGILAPADSASPNESIVSGAISKL